MGTPNRPNQQYYQEHPLDAYYKSNVFQSVDIAGVPYKMCMYVNALLTSTKRSTFL